MKVLYLFIISLCFLLLGGYSNAHAGTHHQTNFSSVKHTQRAQQIKLADSVRAHTVLKGAGKSEEPKFLISNEDEDESLSARKHVLLVKYSLVVAYTFILSYLLSFFKERLPFCSHLPYISSCKYIAQRALRI